MSCSLWTGPLPWSTSTAVEDPNESALLWDAVRTGRAKTIPVHSEGGFDPNVMKFG